MAALALISAAVAGVSGAQAAHDEGTCSGSQLTAVFSVVQGSKTRLVVDYSLRIMNTGSECAVDGVPTGHLLGRNGHVLPTRLVPLKTINTPLYIFLRTHQMAQASAVIRRTAGPGESAKACAPIAYRFRVDGPGGGGTATAPLKPPIRVCHHGQLQFTSWGPG